MSVPQPQAVRPPASGAVVRRLWFRRIVLALSIILLAAAGSVWVGTARGAMDFGRPLGRHWFEARFHSCVAVLDVFTPNDPLVIRMLERASEMPKAPGPWTNGPGVPSWHLDRYLSLPTSVAWKTAWDDHHVLLLVFDSARPLPYLPPYWRIPTCGNEEFLVIPGRDIGGRFPLWAPTALTACYPSVALIGVCRSRRRRRNGLCLNCGYNLTGLPEPRCPECGTKFVPRVPRQEEAGHGAT